MTLETCEAPEIRLSMTEGVYFRNLNGNEAKDVLEITKGMGGENDFEQSVSCIGVPTCQMGVCDSQDALREMISYVKENNGATEYLPKVYFSGCGNSCGVHEIGAIGFMGSERVDGQLLENLLNYSLLEYKETKLDKQKNGESFREKIP